MQVVDAIYEKPLITLMDEDEVLAAFQMTAAEISAAGCWWGGTSVCPNGRSGCAAYYGARYVPASDGGDPSTKAAQNPEGEPTSPADALPGHA